MCNDSPQDVNVDHTVHIYDVPYVNHDIVRNNNEHDIVQSNNDNMNPNNDDNVKVNTNCYYDDTNNNPS